MIKFSVIASGSQGNSTIIKIDETLILIDVGISRTRLTKELENKGFDINDVGIVLVTHTHKDHTKGLKQLLKYHNPILYIGEKMLEEIEIKYDKVKYINGKTNYKNISIESIQTSHDTIESYGFIISIKEKSLVYITDTGYLTNTALSQITNKTAYIIESNHDVEKLMNSARPYFLKQRIIGDKGHLSNEDCANYMKNVISNKTKIVVLAHLSEEVNNEKLAIQSFTEITNNKKIKLITAKQNEATDVQII